MKTQKELNQLKEKYETVINKLKELNDEELKMVTGGNIMKCDIDIRKDLYENIILGGTTGEEKCISWNTHNGVDIEE